MTQETGRRLGRRFDGDRWPPLPLMRGETVIEAPADRNELTRRHTEEAPAFIGAHASGPFEELRTGLPAGDPLFPETNGTRGRSSCWRTLGVRRPVV